MSGSDSLLDYAKRIRACWTSLYGVNDDSDIGSIEEELGQLEAVVRIEAVMNAIRESRDGE